VRSTKAFEERTVSEPSADDQPPPMPPVRDRADFPARRRLAVAAGAVGLIALIVVLLTLPVNDESGTAAPAVPPSKTAPPPPTTVLPPPPAAATTPPPAIPAAPLVAAAPAPPPPSAGPAGRATINASALARNAILRVDGRLVARRRFTLTPGRHVLEATLAGHQPFRDSVLVQPGQVLAWTPTLVPLPATRAAPAAPRPSGRPVPQAPPQRRPPSDEASCQQQLSVNAWSAALPVCMRAARAGSGRSARAIALLYQRGDGVHRSDDSAAAWFGIGARAGDASSMYQLGSAYEHGRGERKDQRTALDWYTRAADAGDPEAQYVVGEAFDKGRLGASRDRGKALQWYRKAAAQGQSDAERRLREIGP
jgi:hypothetical protein